MVVTTKLFGLALAPLYAAIAQVESDCGATSANVYQLKVKAAMEKDFRSAEHSSANLE